MYGTRTDVKMEAAICNIIRQHLSEEQIEKNYKKVYEQVLPGRCAYNLNLMEKVVKECRQMALSQIPKGTFTTLQIMHIRKVWEIDIFKLEHRNNRG